MKDFLFNVNPQFQPENGLLRKLEENTLNRRVKELSELLHPGRKQESIYFIKEGVIRSYTTINELEFTNWFFARGEIVMSLLSFVFNQASEVWLQAITNCELIEMEKRYFLQLRSDFSQFKETTDYMIRDFLRRKEIHQFRLSSFNGEQRYKSFVDESAYVNIRAQVQHIASFLGTKPDNLSRIRKKIN